MKLEVGMYVRTDLGNIGKIVEEYTHQNNKVSYPEPQEWVLDTGYILNEAMMYQNEEITKASHNIIDLIEENDYIRIVTSAYFEPVYYSYGKLVIRDDIDINKYTNKFIAEVITHEQMKSMSYKVGE